MQSCISLDTVKFAPKLTLKKTKKGHIVLTGCR